MRLSATLLLLLASCGVEGEDDASFLPFEESAPPLRLLVTDLVPGQVVTLRATGATPGHRIWFARSTRGTGAGICPPVFNGMCTDILSPTALSSAVADPQGVATWSVQLPANLGNGLDVWFQAYQYQTGAPYSSDVAQQTVGQPCAEDNRENNDQLGSARTLVAGAVNGLRSCGGDHDWFSVLLTAGDSLEVNATFRVGEGDIDVRVTDPAGNWLANGASPANNERVVYRAVNTGMHYIDIELMNDFGRASGNDYDLNITLGAGQCLPDAYEPNDAANTATTLAPGFYQGLTACSVVQDDYYQLAVTPGQVVTATATFAPAEGDIDLYMYDANGGFLDSSTGVGATETVSWTATTNTNVRVRATLVWPDPGNPGQTYDLDLQRAP